MSILPPYVRATDITAPSVCANDEMRLVHLKFRTTGIRCSSYLFPCRMGAQVYTYTVVISYNSSTRGFWQLPAQESSSEVRET
jgi:hypothetical protein